MDTTTATIRTKHLTDSLRWADELRRKEAEILELRAQRDMLRDALDELVAEFDAVNESRDACKEGLLPDTGGMLVARAVLAACRD